MKIYIDSEYKCHTTNQNGDFREVEHSFFDGKCQTFIEGYRYVPSGESWTRFDGRVFRGEILAPCKPYEELDNVQREYEKQLLAEYESALADMKTALNTLGVTLDEETVD